MNDEYRTLKGPSEGLYKEKGSKFIAHAIPVSSLEEVKSNLERLRKIYHDARHHCYAYRIGEEPGETRYNDDGEPSGTAGKPIFGQIQSYDLTNVLIVVVRYFGGIKLGTGGLMQAYKTASKDAIENGSIVMKTWMNILSIGFKYEQMNEIMHMIKEEDLHPKSQEFDLKCHIVLEIRRGKTEEFLQKISSAGMVEVIVI
jgi:uncharacterized YigZ family protein